LQRPRKTDGNRELGRWVEVLRKLKRRGILSVERFGRLEEIGFVWDMAEADWEQHFIMLREYKAKHGDCNVPLKWGEDRDLGRWVARQRHWKRRGILSVERIGRLEEIGGFVWDPFDAAWEQHFIMLREYKEKHGDCNVPKRCQEDADLGRWVNAQRTQRRLGKVSEKHIQQLTQLGFEWEPVGSSWEKRFKELLEYRRQHGDCNVPTRNRSLGKWVSSQRSLNRKKQLRAERVRHLGEIGFKWDLIAGWDENFTELKAYQKRFGNCNVPTEYEKNPVLGSWVSGQRRLYKSGRLADERFRLLSELGFNWDAVEYAWERFFAELLTYKKEHGDCNVPRRYTAQAGLGAWVTHQRHLKKSGKLSKQCLQRLNAIEFEWSGRRLGRNGLRNQRDENWNEMLAQLVAFRKKCGHCHVPKRYPANPELSRWVRNQRALNSLGTLNPQRVGLLNRIGFQWKIRAGKQK
jgi:hypothetical protein